MIVFVVVENATVTAYGRSQKYLDLSLIELMTEIESQRRYELTSERCFLSEDADMPPCEIKKPVA